MQVSFMDRDAFARASHNRDPDSEDMMSEHNSE